MEPVGVTVVETASPTPKVNACCACTYWEIAPCDFGKRCIACGEPMRKLTRLDKADLKRLRKQRVA